jgi:hypothetical protein
MNTENINNLLTSLDLSQKAKARLEIFLINIFEKQKLNSLTFNHLNCIILLDYCFIDNKEST